MTHTIINSIDMEQLHHALTAMGRECAYSIHRSRQSDQFWPTGFGTFQIAYSDLPAARASHPWLPQLDPNRKKHRLAPTKKGIISAGVLQELDMGFTFKSSIKKL